MLISALASTSLMCLVDEPKIATRFSEFLLHMQGRLPQTSVSTGLTGPSGSLLMSTDKQQTNR